MPNVSILNTTVNVSGKTVLICENSHTITGLQTFNRSPSAPFAVAAGSAVVTNLDADKVDGYEAAALAVLAENETVSGAWTFSGAVSITAASVGLAVTNNATVGGTLGVTGVTTLASVIITSAGAAITLSAGGAASGIHQSGGQNLRLTSNADVVVQVDADNNGTNVFGVENGGGTSVFNVNEAGVVNVSAHLATPAGGSTSVRLVFGTTAGFGIYVGSGAPSVSAAQGSLYLRSDGSSASTRAYINTDGGTTWTAITTAA